MSWRRTGIAALACLLLALLAGGVTLHRAWTLPTRALEGDTLIQIPVGLGSREIAEQLAGAGVLDSPRLFLWGLWIFDSGRDLKAGRYLFNRPSAPASILAKLRRGETEKLWLTLPEGLWLDEAVGLIAGSLGLDSLDLAERVRRPEDWSYPYLDGRGSLEGFLFPDTYAFEYPAEPGVVLDHILADFNENMQRLLARAQAEWSLTVVEWVTLASIVEAEVRLPEERSGIAAVYLNRLRLGMKLEADPTVMYALGRRRSRLYYKHLKVDSPYNTYLHSGLPPGPICSPGLESLESLLQVDSQDRNLYFVASGSGGHLFSETYAEHREKVASVRRRMGPR